MTLINQLQELEGGLAILIDPDKTNQRSELEPLVEKVNLLDPAFIFVGGSTVDEDDFENCIVVLKELTDIPVIIFPGSFRQLSDKADGILFLSLVSGRNPDYLIGHQVEAAPHLRKMNVEVMPTAYLLIDGGKNSSVAYVSQTTPIPNDQTTIAINTSIAGEMMGMQAVFLDAGSGAKNTVSPSMISDVKQNIDVPLIVGGGIRSVEDYEAAKGAGANLIVIGNKIEEDMDFLLDLMNITIKENFTSN